MFHLMNLRKFWRTLKWSSEYVGTCRLLSSKVPDLPTWQPIETKSLPEVPKLDDEMIEHLERLSLVEFNNKEGVERLRKAIEYANQLHVINTEGVEPMYSVLEDRHLLLDEDKVVRNIPRHEVLRNAVLTEEDLFVAPPGNVPLSKENKANKNDIPMSKAKENV